MPTPATRNARLQADLTVGAEKGRLSIVHVALALVGLGFCGSFLLTSDAAMLFGIVDPALKFLISPWMIAANLLTAGFVACGFLLVRQFRLNATEDADSALRRNAVFLVLMFSVFSLGLVAIGGWFARDLYLTTREQTMSSVQSLSRLRAQQVDKWLFERSRDVTMLSAPLVQLPFEKWKTSRDVRAAAELLIFELISRSEEESNVKLLSPAGEELLVLGKDLPDWPHPAAVATNLQKNTAVTIDSFVRVDGQDVAAAVSFTQPLVRPSDGQLLGTLRLTIDPRPTLARIVRDWPVPTATGEVMLLTRDNANGVALTPSRFDPSGTTPRLIRRPLSATHLPAVAALVQGDGVREGPDYRDVVVISASTRVVGVPWHVFAKIDRAEAFAPLDRKYVILASTIAAAILLAGLMVLVVWRGQRRSFVAYTTHSAREHQALTDHYRSLVESARDIVLLTGPDGEIVEANDAAAAAYGYTLGELPGMNVRDLNVTAPSGAGERRLAESLQRRKDGTTFPAEITGRALEIMGRTYRQSFIRDISVRKALEARIARLSRIKQALQGATSALLRARSADEAMREMCRVLVEDGGYLLAHVAAANDDPKKSVRFLATAGSTKDYLLNADITWGEGPRGKGPTGTALREGVVRVNQNFDLEAMMAPWTELARQHGLRSSAGVPVKVNGHVFAALTLYAALPDAFDEEEVSLLTTLADDLAWTLAHFQSSDRVIA